MGRRLTCRTCGKDMGEASATGTLWTYCSDHDPELQDPEPIVLQPIRYRGANGKWYDDECEARSKYTFSD